MPLSDLWVSLGCLLGAGGCPVGACGSWWVTCGCPMGAPWELVGALGACGSTWISLSDPGCPVGDAWVSSGLPWRVALGSATHSLADGLALGAAFTHSWRSGTATALALLGHELPHALGERGSGCWVLGVVGAGCQVGAGDVG